MLMRSSLLASRNLKFILKIMMQCEDDVKSLPKMEHEKTVIKKQNSMKQHQSKRSQKINDKIIN